MPEQLALIAAPPKLTERQQLAFEFISNRQPVSSEEFGAFLHEDRRDRGGRGHDAEARCRYCHDEGSHMGAALRRHKLVVQKRGLGWCTPDYKPERTNDTSAMQGPSATTDEHGFPLDF